MSRSPRIAVIGSANTDLTTFTERIGNSNHPSGPSLRVMALC